MMKKRIIRLTNPHVVAELKNAMVFHMQVHEVHHRHIAQIHVLPACSGMKTLGQRIGRVSNSEVLSEIDTNMGDVMGDVGLKRWGLTN